MRGNYKNNRDQDFESKNKNYASQNFESGKPFRNNLESKERYQNQDYDQERTDSKPRGARGNRRGRFNRGRNSYQTEERKEDYKQVPRSFNSENKPKAQPVFQKVNDLEPEARSINVKVKAVSDPQIISPVSAKSKKLWEVITGDETGVIKLELPDDSFAKTVKTGSTIIVRNGFVDMRDGKFMILATNQWGKLEVSESDLGVTINKTNNVSEVEYELTS